ncbi:protein ROOT HAIR DEFECTIVE 3-like isoform X2 [Typha latifolia]|uniref:protein ROOT HAIR DEFECTIVE 3-like isoform X2 n=1 Tax=Typha latifolia TaxID=4733 RepID=UPI003C2E7880
MEAQGGVIQMITGEGDFNAPAVDVFIRASQEFTAPHASYTVVSIIRPQSSGKSYLLNSLFRTNFGVMRADENRGQTTKGIWMARCIRPCMIIMDVEGCDGTEREDDTLFEKQNALFALTVSDVILVNMWLHDIGRQQGGNIPLLTLILQERIKLDPCKTKVIFVIRDYDYETPPGILTEKVMESINKIWESVKPGHRNAKLSDYFQVSAVFLPRKCEEKAFKEKCTELQKLFSTGNLAGSRQDKVPASGFSFSAKGLWDNIRQNRNINLPAYKEFVAITMCDKIMKEILGSLASMQDYLHLKSCSSITSDFNNSLQSLLDRMLAKYDEEAYMYVANVRDKTRSNLETEILHLLEPICKAMLQTLPTEIFVSSKDEIDAALNSARSPSDSVNIVVKPYLDKFDNSCAGLHQRYESMVTGQHAKLEKVLVSYAQEKANSIEWKRGLRKGFKIATVGFAICRLAFGDPTSLADLAAFFFI